MMLQERKTTLDTSCFLYEQQTDFTSVTSLWRNGQRIRLLIWGLRVRVPPGMCFWYFVGGSPFFPLALYSTAPLFLVQGGVALLCLGCSRLKCGSCWRLRIKLAGKLFYLNKQQTNNNKQTTTNKQQTNNKHDGGFSASKHVLAPTKKSKITLRKLLLLIEKQKKIRCLNNSRPFCGRISFSSPTDVKVLFQSGPFLAM